ncbi:MAG: hypothetical protein A2087_09285 [Spirochaetes bacterium GWD1_61_31]|nr:MAG: hypothetical protein A2Y37_07485 [Spirochaetes bacterium GWB1_60_80]OHD34669.1 MAG: hypothetical protein A2004_01345 [Spirochaetes bacterium GWC1_61_12]OHD36049.1 MAG: hypothetical protein A2087_09285 [Spirochaetes bacterium GWD1_61_31]OHD42434.1 MAG: hypothetical protein A2Y35_06275 [Spirochaetes bacterium GWE1_60_18]OHD59236.1 MAG: hypothetical protein A2Y32_00455 [Spirochaetes bacterium GWF1_60_12]HAP43061.1 hypothetical protein [Spirochaetaceae bacterium]
MVRRSDWSSGQANLILTRLSQNQHYASVNSLKRPPIIFLGLSTFQVLAMFRRGIFYTFLGVYLRSYLGLSVTETTLFETIPMVFNILFQTLVWGRLTDRLQLRRGLLIIGELLAGVGHLLMWFLHAATPDPRLAGFVIIGGLTVIEVFWSMSNIGWSAYISDVYNAGERNAVQGKLASLGGVGRIIGALAGGALYDRLGTAFPGWGFKAGGIFIVSAAVMIVSVVPFFFMPEGGIKAQPPSANKPTRLATDASPAARGDFRVFAVFLVAMLLINSGVNSMAAVKGQFLDLREGFAASATTISLVNNIESLALIVAGLFIGRLGGRFGIRTLLVAGAVCGIGFLVAYSVAPALGFIYPVSILKGLSDALLAGSAYALASILIPPEKRGRYFAAYNASFMLSWGVSATLITGPLIDSLIGHGVGPVLAYRAGLASSALVSAAGLVVLLGLLRQTRQRASSEA